MTVTTGNVLVGTAQLYVAPYGSSGEPMPADTVLLGTPWGGNWVPMGGTQGGVKLTVNPKTIDITIEEQPTPVLVVQDTVDIAVSTTLSEDILANMKIAYGGGNIAVQAPGSSLIGKSTLTLADVLDLLSVGFEGKNSFGFFRRLYVPKVVSVAQVDTTYRRAAAQRLYPTNLRAICDPSLVTIEEMTAVHT